MEPSNYFFRLQYFKNIISYFNILQRHPRFFQKILEQVLFENTSISITILSFKIMFKMQVTSLFIGFVSQWPVTLKLSYLRDMLSNFFKRQILLF